MRPDIAEAFAHLNSLIAGAMASAPLERVTAFRSVMERYGDVAPRAELTGVTVQPLSIGPLAAEWICAPGAQTQKRVLYLHGGSMMFGSLHSHRMLAAELARQSGLAILTLDYRLAPEHVFPAAHEDCAAAWAFIAADGPQGSSPAERLFVCGDSAGGNLAAGLCARLIEEKGRIPDALALLGAGLDNRDNPGRAPSPGDPVVNNDAIGGIAAYAGGVARDDPRISPLLLDDKVLAQFPPTLLQASAAEYLLDDARHFSARLTALDRRNILSVWPALPHVWHLFQASLPEAKAAVAEVAQFLTATER